MPNQLHAISCGLCAAIGLLGPANVLADAPAEQVAGRVVHASDVERRIYAALKMPVSFDVGRISLERLAEHVRAKFEIPVDLDDVALDTEGYPSELPHLVTVGDKPLAPALSAMLGPERLGYAVWNGTLMFTTAAAVPTRHDLRTYRVEDLVYAGAIPGAVAPDFKPLIERMETRCGRKAGNLIGDMQSFEGPGIAVLVVRQAPEGHLRIEKVLDSLAAEGAGERKPAPLTVDDSATSFRPPPGKWSPRSKAEAEIRRALANPSRLERREWQLAELAEAIGRRHEIDVEIDLLQLVSEGKDETTPVRTTTDDGSLDDILTAALERQGLTRVVGETKLEITTKTSVAGRKPMRIRQVPDLLFAHRHMSRRQTDMGRLCALIESFSRGPALPPENDRGDVRPFLGPSTPVLVMKQSDTVYRQIDRLLSMLGAAYVPELHAAQLGRAEPEPPPSGLLK